MPIYKVEVAHTRKRLGWREVEAATDEEALAIVRAMLVPGASMESFQWAYEDCCRDSLILESLKGQNGEEL